MTKVKKFLFSPGKLNSLPSFALLILRLASGMMMIPHGWNKLSSFNTIVTDFPDPLQVGNTASLGLVVFAEFFCAILLILGLGTRFVSVPLVILMVVITFVIHAGDPFSDKELPMLYLAVYTSILIFGAGNYSLDRLISGK